MEKITKSTKRLVALLLSLVLAMSVWGCDSKESNDAEKGNGNNSAETENTEDGEFAQKEVPVFVFRGISDRESKSDNDLVKQKIEELSGIEFDYVVIPYQDWDQKFNAMVASGEEVTTYDMIANSKQISSIIERNAILPLDDMIEEYLPNYLKVVPEEAWQVVKSNGQIWGLPGKELFVRGGLPVVREDWLEELGMENPTTMEELETLFEKIKMTDLNGNGTNDEIPLVSLGMDATLFLRNYYLGFSGEEYVDENGEVKPWYVHEGVYTMLKKLNEWYEKGYLYSEFETLAYEEAMDLATAERIGVYACWYNDPIYGSASLVEEDPSNPVSWTALNVLTDVPEGGRAAWYSNPEYRIQLSLSSTSSPDAAEAALRLVDWIYESVDNYMLVTYGIEGVHWEYVDEEKTQFRYLEGAGDKYASFFQFSEWYDSSIFPSLVVEESDYAKFQMQKVQNEANALEMYPADDWFMTYDLTDTAAADLTSEATDWIKEAAIKVIKGDYNEEDWNRVVEECWETDGSIRSEVWTEQYNAAISE